MTEVKSFSLSFCVHLLIFAAFIHWQFDASTPLKTGDAEKTVLASYLVHATPPAKQTMPLTPVVPNALALRHEKKVVTSHASKASSSQHSSIAGKQMSELTSLLHAAIQSAQKYPASAQEMGREGRSTVGFVLHRDGSVSNLQLLHSSGTNSIDSAALAAVNDAAPFRQVNRYLNSAQPYQIDVVFLL